MLFNSLDFAVFLPFVFFLYWFVFKNNLRSQNFLIVIASYIFYGWWDWRFLILIVFSTLIDFLIGIELGREGDKFKRKGLLIFSIMVNIGLLGFFKYFNFFLENFTAAFSIVGMPIQANSLEVILPVGISFYTFQTLSYSIDVYRRKLEPTRDWISFAAFVSFFPQLVAGPIERASNLLPQFYQKRVFDPTAAGDGLRQILWGLVKKMVIADNSAEYANLIFNNSSEYSGSTLVLGAFFFSFQIYGDFSGYSDIAIGTSRLFGFSLMQNFAFPYFSRDVAEFWRRWHMSLTTWFRDYVYIPLGGSRGNLFENVRNTFIIFLISGFWHGANWTFIVWGVFHALCFLPSLILGKNRKNLEVTSKGNRLPSFKEAASILSTFILTGFAWIFFRAENLGHALSYISGIFSENFFSAQNSSNLEGSLTVLVLIVGFTVIEWKGREGQYAIWNMGIKKSRMFRWSVYLLLILVIDIFGNTSEELEFIYFQF